MFRTVCASVQKPASLKGPLVSHSPWYVCTCRASRLDLRPIRPHGDEFNPIFESICLSLRRAGRVRAMVSQGQAAQSETKVSAASRVRASGSGQAFGGMFNRSKSELSIVQTIQLLKSRGLNVALDSSQLPAWYMIDSRTSKHISKWDFTLVIALVVVALLTPFEVAFLPPAQAIDWLFWVNRVLDLVFTMDMVVICFRIVAVTSHVEGMRWIVKPKELFARYYKSGWFFVDLFTLIVSLMDVVTPLLKPEDASVIRKFKVCAPHPHPPAQHLRPNSTTCMPSSRFSHPIKLRQHPSQHARHPPHPSRRRCCAFCGRYAWRGSPSSSLRRAFSRSWRRSC